MGKARLKRSAIVLALALGACAAPPAAPLKPPPAAPPPVAAPPPPAPPPAAPPTYAQSATPSRDQCGADQLQWLVGRSRLEIPVPLEPGRRRVLCTTCPMSREHVPTRQTILYDAASATVTSIACG